MTDTTRHRTERVRHDPKRRRLTVEAITDVTPRLRRIEFTSPDLADFDSRSPDDHIKIFVADPTSADGLAMRDYTPRAFDAARRVLTIDFALHDAGIVTSWAKSAAIGDALTIGGPRGSMIVPDDFDYQLLVGDQTALPSIARRLETLGAGLPVTAVILVDGPEEIQTLRTDARLDPIWLCRDGRPDGEILLSALDAWRAPQGDGHVWIAAEASAARMVKEYMLNRRGHPKAWLKAAGYWVRGEAGTSDEMTD